MNELALFAGAGGGILGGHMLGWRTVCAVEIDDYARRVLLARQRDGCLPRFPIWDDITTFDGRPWRERIDVISGGFPCQDISAAGKGAGITGSRSGLWTHMARVIGEVRPRYCFVENSPLLVSRGLDTVLSDLAEMGFNASWGIVGAHHVGAPHKRDRIWIVANANSDRGQARATKSEWRSPIQLNAVSDGAGHVADREHDRAEWWQQQPERGEGARHVADAEQNRFVSVSRDRRGAESEKQTSEFSSRRSQYVADADKLERGYTAAGWAAGAESDDQGEGLADADESGRHGRAGAEREADGRRQPADGYWWESEPDVC